MCVKQTKKTVTQITQKGILFHCLLSFPTWLLLAAITEKARFGFLEFTLCIGINPKCNVFHFIGKFILKTET